MNMLTKLKNNSLGSWKWFTKKPWRFVFVIIFFLITFSVLRANGDEYEQIVAESRELSRTVLSSGEVVSTVDLSLSFPRSGVVKDVKVKIGDKVEKDQILALTNQGTLNAAVTQALGSLRASQARLEQVIEGATNEDIKISEVNLQNAIDNLAQVRNEQKVAVENARRILNSSDLEAIAESSYANTTSIYISGSYNSDKTGKFYLNRTINNSNWVLSGPANFQGDISTLTPDPVGSTGLFLLFSTKDFSFNDSWTIEIPNTKGPSYKTNKSSYDAAVANSASLISTAENNVRQKEAELALKKKDARPSEISAAEADILQAQGRLQAAQAELNDTYLRAPEAGTITAINVKTGELAEVQSVAMVLENTDSLYVESNINEANIDLVYKDAPVEITFDAFPGKVYQGKISFVEPSETLIGGVVNYKVKAVLLETDSTIRPGLTANLLIVVWKAVEATTIPDRAIFQKDGKDYVLLKTGKKDKHNTEVEIQKGKIGDGAIAEIEKGLKSGDVVLIKKEE